MKKINNNLLLSIEIKDFITRIQLSKARKPIYYEFNGKHSVPPTKSKHITPNGKKKFNWSQHKIGANLKLLLTEVSTGLPVIKNARAAGTPKYLAIKGNNIYSGFGGYRNRVIIMNGIKDFFRPFISAEKKITEFPLCLNFIIYDQLNLVSSKGKSQSQDLDNLFSCYIKSLLDLMKECSIIPDDNLMFVRKITCEFIESSNKVFVLKAFKYEEK